MSYQARRKKIKGERMLMELELEGRAWEKHTRTDRMGRVSPQGSPIYQELD